MKTYQPLKIVSLDRETRDSLRIGLKAVAASKNDYQFSAGQHLPLQVTVDGRKLRRTYSICSAAAQPDVLEIGVRVQPGGAFSNFAAEHLAIGDELESLPPSGRFTLDGLGNGDVLLIAAGSGITPILSMLRELLESSPTRRVVLLYGNRRRASTMFVEDLYALKNRYCERLQLHFAFSQEPQEFEIMNGRLDGPMIEELYRRFCAPLNIEAAFVCGPDTMIDDATRALQAAGLEASQVHAERFGIPRGKPQPAASENQSAATVTVVMDGQKQSFAMSRDAANLVDAAAEHDIDLPYSCKGGVCATCRCHVREGEVVMATNYGLEPWEVEQGYVLACQSRPVSKTVTLDYDRT